jgi:hypothetical protein
MKRLRQSLLTLALATCGWAQATVLVNNMPDRVGGDNMSIYKVADNFSLAGSFNITGFSFWSLQLVPEDYSGTLHWAIYGDSAGSPGALRGSGSATPGGVAGSTGVGPLNLYNEFQYTVSGLSLALGSGSYWLAVENEIDGSPNYTDMMFGSSATGDAPAGKYFDFGLTQWVTSEFQHAFQISGEAAAPPPPGVPTPSTLALLAGGLLAAGVLRRSRRETLAS